MNTIDELETVEQDSISIKEKKEVQFNNATEAPVKQFFNNSPNTNNNYISEPEEEDDINTVASGETSHYKNKDNRKIPPTFIRYQFGIVLDNIKLRK